jgi:broad specificity phosphatase PhoE
MTREDLERDDPARYQRWRAGEDVIAEVGGESDVVLRERAGAVFSRLLGLRGGPHVADGGAPVACRWPCRRPCRGQGRSSP